MKESAKRLYDHLKNRSWFRNVGISENHLIVYLDQETYDSSNEIVHPKWEGLKVETRNIGTIHFAYN
jgi:hypothetical protein